MGVENQEVCYREATCLGRPLENLSALGCEPLRHGHSPADGACGADQIRGFLPCPLPCGLGRSSQPGPPSPQSPHKA